MNRAEIFRRGHASELRMTSSKIATATFVLAAMLLVAGTATSRARASCSPRHTQLVGGAANLPTNVQLVVSLGYHESLRAQLPAITLVGARGAVGVHVTRDTGVPSRDVRIGRHLVVAPASALAPNDAYTLRVGRARFRLRTAAGPDTRAPSLASAAINARLRESDHVAGCGSLNGFVIALTADRADAVVAHVTLTPAGAQAPPIRGLVEIHDGTILVGESGCSATLTFRQNFHGTAEIAVVDRAGNISAPLRVAL